MYIDKLSLFVIGEVLIVYVIINIFLFYRSRLLKVLLALLKEYRYNRAYRNSQKARDRAKERAENRSIAKDLNLEGPATFTNHLEIKLQNVTAELNKLKAENELEQEATDLEDMVDIRKSYLELERQIENDPEKEKELLEEFVKFHQIPLASSPDHSAEAIANLEEAVQKLTAENLHYKARTENLQRYESLYEEAHQELVITREALASYKTIDENILAGVEPRKEHHANEIHQLKSDKFDLMEELNKLKLQIDQYETESDSEDLKTLNEERLTKQAKYMKEADVCIELLEKELEAATKENMILQTRLLEAESKASVKKPTVSKESLEELAKNQQQQIASVSSIRRQIAELETIEAAKDIVETQKVEIDKLEHSMQEAEGCISMLEDELEKANKSLAHFEEKVQELDEFENENNELAESLEELVGDSKEMVTCIEKLEEENEKLKQQLNLPKEKAG